MKNQITEQDFYNLLMMAVTKAGSQKAYAEKIGVSGSYLSDVLKARRAPGMQIMRDLGYRRAVVYIPEQAGRREMNPEYESIQYIGNNGFQVSVFADAAHFRTFDETLVLVFSDRSISISKDDYLFKDREGKVVSGNPA